MLDAEGRRIDVEASDAALKASLDQVKGVRRTGNVTSSSPAARGEPVQERLLDQVERAEPGDRSPSGKGDSGYWASKAKREAAEAQLSEMKALREAGALTSTAGVRKAASETGRRVRNGLQAIPDRTSSVLASMTSPAEIHKYLTSEINKALRELGAELDERATAASRADQPDMAVV